MSLSKGLYEFQEAAPFAPVAEAAPPAEKKSDALSVSAAMQLAKRALEGFVVTMVGEVSEVNNKPGYKAVYFTVKDKESSLPCMMWVSRYRACGLDLRVGQLIELTGRFTLYAAKGRMNFDAFSFKLAGEGDLRAKVAQLAQKLEAEGLTSPQRKREIPLYPQVIGLVTSPRGAAVHDVLRTLRRRFPVARVVLAGVPVEGVQAPRQLAEGLACVSRAGAEVVLLVRGGGSFEDLMPFNDEGLARAVAACPVPVVTGIGHEPDTTIADLVADKRASTPTAAAEAVSPSAQEMAQNMAVRQHRLKDGLGRRLERSKLVLQRYADRPLMKDPSYLYAAEAQALDVAAQRLDRAIPTVMERNRGRLELDGTRLEQVGKTLLGGFAQTYDRKLTKMEQVGKNLVPTYTRQVALGAAQLEALSPLAVLSRGYAVARTPEGAVVKQVSQVAAGDNLNVTVSDGVIACTVQG